MSSFHPLLRSCLCVAAIAWLSIPLSAQQVTTGTAPVVRKAAPVVSTGTPWNQLILDQIHTMPSGGGYSAGHFATQQLGSAIRSGGSSRGLVIDADSAHPSYCSGATYLVFLKTVAALRARGELASLDDRAIDALLVAGQRDGQGVWGRWNANGPGTARLFHELGLGRNFTGFDAAQPGDFMKIFWSGAIGKREHGHSVIYLGRETGPDGIEQVRFWSSNLRVGYSEKTVPRKKIAYAVFSRLEKPERLALAPALSPMTDPYLASLLSKDSSVAELQEKCGM